MDTSGIIGELEATVATQLAIGAADPAVVAAGDALLAALRPAVERAVFQLAEQAAAEIGAQLPDHEVEVVVADGEPSLTVRATQSDVPFSTEDLVARLTLRLPTFLKDELESAADSSGDSINTYVVKTLSKPRGGGTRSGKRIRETFHT